VAGGVYFVPGASGLEGVANLSDFERQDLLSEMGRLDERTDVAVLDCGAGLSSGVLSFALAADLDLLVTTPEPTAMTDAYAVVKALAGQGKPPGSVRLVVNLADSRQAARKVYRRVSGVAERFLHFDVADAGYLLHDTHVELAVRQRSPFVLRYPRSAASVCISAIAGRLSGSIAATRTAGGFFRRVVGMFV
jgi:flagellar biosynthesis protein FlhG